VNDLTWVQIQQAAQHTWDDHQKVGALIGDEKPDGLIVRAAGEVAAAGRASPSGSRNCTAALGARRAQVLSAVAVR
jgi:hypothetical protein